MTPSAHRRAIGALTLLAVGLLAVPDTAIAQADALQIRQLEQDVRDLRRMVELQQRRLDELERAAGRTARTPASGAAPRAAPSAAATEAPWLQAANWERVRPGLGELEVISLLGPPTSMRTDALEIGASGFLGGRVLLQDRRVVDVEAPRLR